MTELSLESAPSALSDFFADTDIESLRLRGLSEFNIDIAGVYCLHTGRKVGTFDDFVIQFAIDEELSQSDEDLIHSLFARVVASMRPTPMLNRPDRVTLLRLAEKFPVDILSYLVNRLHSNAYLATHRDPDFLAPYIARITTHQLWTELAAEGVSLTPWIHWLLELDAKRNLHELTPPTGEFDRLGKWIETKTGESLFRQINNSNFDALLAVFEIWTHRRVGEFNVRDSVALKQEQWMRGNSMTQTAYGRSWMKNPDIVAKREVMHRPLRGTGGTQVKPKKPLSQVEQKLQQFMHLLDGIIDSSSESIKPATVAKSKPAILTGGSLFQKKVIES